LIAALSHSIPVSCCVIGIGAAFGAHAFDRNSPSLYGATVGVSFFGTPLQKLPELL
jgi:hypothetical protein|tara:strand:+ start:1972 stop:2139 length:168 start_codon:yes stop_codon:yes gene_type:complete